MLFQERGCRYRRYNEPVCVASGEEIKIVYVVSGEEMLLQEIRCPSVLFQETHLTILCCFRRQ